MAEFSCRKKWNFLNRAAGFNFSLHQTKIYFLDSPGRIVPSPSLRITKVEKTLNVESDKVIRLDRKLEEGRDLSNTSVLKTDHC